MAFSCKIILAKHKKMDGSRMVYLQAIIDRLRAEVSLGFYVKDDMFDGRRQCMKAGHPNAKDYDTEFLQAIAKANSIASKYRIEGRSLTPMDFRNEFKDTPIEMDFIKFFDHCLNLKKPALALNTYKSHTTVLNKLRDFRTSGLPFNQITMEFLQKFRNFLILKGNGGSTIEKVMKIMKQYLREAKAKGISTNTLEIKIKTFRSNRNALTEAEVQRMTAYMISENCPENHRKLLRYFLFSCYTGVRISDIRVLTWRNVQDDLLVYVPIKTKYNNEKVIVPLLEIDKSFMPLFTSESQRIFETFADPVSNRLLKDIAVKLDIRKSISYHTSRHTFGSMMAEGGDIVATQRMMGHGDLKTTMGYVHTNVKQLVDAKKARFEK